MLAVATWLGRNALSRFYCGPNVALVPLCAQYVSIRALALPAVIIATVAQALCIGIKDTRTPMLAVALAAAINFGGDLLLVTMLNLGIAGASCNPADLANQFGVLDLSDINAFVSAFTNSEPLADLAPPFGVFDLADINTFVSAFLAGCP